METGLKRFRSLFFNSSNDMDSLEMPFMIMNPLTIDHLVENVVSFQEGDVPNLLNDRLISQTWDKEAAKRLIKIFKRHERTASRSLMFQSGVLEDFYEMLPSGRIQKVKLFSSGLNIGLELKNFSLFQAFRLILNFSMNVRDTHWAQSLKLKNQIQTLQHSKFPEFLSGLALNGLLTTLGQEKTKLFLEKFGKYFRYLQCFLHSDADLENIYTAVNQQCPNISQIRIKVYLSLNHPLQKSFTVSKPLKSLQEIQLLDQFFFGRYSPRFQQFVISLFEQSLNLRSLIMYTYCPLNILVSISNMIHITNNLEKLEIMCKEVAADAFIEFLSRIQFKNVSSLKLTNLNIAHGSVNRLLVAWSRTLRKLTLRSMDDESDPELQGIFLRVLVLLPNLESLKLSGIFHERSYHRIFEDLRRSELLHRKLSHFKLEHTEKDQYYLPIIEPRIAPAALDLLALKDGFPNLTSLRLYIVREAASSIPLSFLKEMCEISQFPNLETLKFDIDEFSIGEDIFRAIGILQRMRKLKYLQVENSCRSCRDMKPGECKHRETCTPEQLKEMLVRLRHLDKIILINFNRFFVTEKEMNKSLQFTRKFRNIEFCIVPRIVPWLLPDWFDFDD